MTAQGPDPAQPFVPFDELVDGLRGLMRPDDRLDLELRELDDESVEEMERRLVEGYRRYPQEDLDTDWMLRGLLEEESW